jgi:hypothetical protein
LLRGKDTSELLGKITSIFLAVLDSDAKREFLRIHNVADRPLETTDVVISNGYSSNLDLFTHSVNTDAKSHGRLLVPIDKTVRSEA